MKVVVIGLGSMGKRRLRLVEAMYGNEIEVFGVDCDRERAEVVSQQYGIKIFKDVENAINTVQPNACFVCTSPDTHAALIRQCLMKGCHVFTELNLISAGYEELIRLSEDSGKVLYLSSTLLFRKEIEYIHQKVASLDARLHYRYHVGQYLPDWHPWEDFKDFFVSNPKTNGCREIFAIELPWLLKVFGKVQNLHSISDRISTLGIDYPDSYIVTLEHESGSKGVISVDVVSRSPVRNFELYNEDLHLFWDGRPVGLQEYDLATKELYQVNVYDSYDHHQSYAENIIEDAYAEEIRQFITQLGGGTISPRYSIEDDKYTLSLIDRIEGICT